MGDPCAGWLYKSGAVNKSLKRRWFACDGGTMTISYGKTMAGAKKGAINLSGCTKLVEGFNGQFLIITPSRSWDLHVELPRNACAANYATSATWLAFLAKETGITVTGCCGSPSGFGSATREESIVLIGEAGGVLPGDQPGSGDDDDDDDDDDDVAAAEWEENVDDSGRAYYVNSASGESRWERPAPTAVGPSGGASGGASGASPPPDAGPGTAASADPAAGPVAYPAASLWGVDYVDPARAGSAAAAEMLACDPRSISNTRYAAWMRLPSQPTTQPMVGSKAHLPFCFFTIPRPLPKTVDEFLALRASFGTSTPESATALFQVAMVVYTRDTEVGARCFVICADAKHLMTPLPSRCGEDGQPKSKHDFRRSFKNKIMKYDFPWQGLEKRLRKAPYIATSRFVGATADAAYDIDTLPVLQLMIADRFAGDPRKGDQSIARRSIHYCKSGKRDAFVRPGTAPHGDGALFVLKQNTRGVWKVYQWDAAHMMPSPPTVADDGDDI